MPAGIDASGAAEFSLRHSMTEYFFVEGDNCVCAGNAGRAAVEPYYAQSGSEEKAIGQQRQGKEKGESADEFGSPNRDAEIGRVDKGGIAAEIFNAEMGKGAVQDKRGGKDEEREAAAANQCVIADDISNNQRAGQEVNGRQTKRESSFALEAHDGYSIAGSDGRPKVKRSGGALLLIPLCPMCPIKAHNIRSFHV